MGGGRGLADAALEVRDRNGLGRKTLGPPGAVFTTRRALGCEMIAQAQDIVEGELQAGSEVTVIEVGGTQGSRAEETSDQN